MIIDENSMNNNIIVVLADTKEKAMSYGLRVRPTSLVGIMPMHQRSELYLLYGHRGMPFIVVPGTIVQRWHKELDHHINSGRIKPIGRYRRVQVN